MQALDPLRVVDVGLAPRNGAGVARIGQHHVQTVTLENLVDRNPIHPGRLHRHRGDSQLDQPIGHALQVGGKRLEGLHRLFGEIDGHCHHMEARTDVDAGRTLVNHWQTLPLRTGRLHENPPLTGCAGRGLGSDHIPKRGHETRHH
ncbi:hypothetical protein D9M68_634390 [compost metagenome]